MMVPLQHINKYPPEILTYSGFQLQLLIKPAYTAFMHSLHPQASHWYEASGNPDHLYCV